MSGVVTSQAVLATTALYSAYSGYQTRKDTKAARASEEAKQKKMEEEQAAQEAADKAKLMREKYRRMSSGGYEGTVLAGVTGGTGATSGAATLLGSVGQ